MRFDRFFNEQFADVIGKFQNFGAANDSKLGRDEKSDEHGFGALVVGPNYPEALVQLYDKEMAHVQHNYHLVGQLDVSLLKEFQIDPKRIMSCLKDRLKGLRNTYWMELFSNLNTVTNRLTAQSRKNLLDTLHQHVQVDFTVGNILEIVLWVIKNANRYIDSQLLSTYELMVAKCNVQMYKSNQRTWVEDRWRYNGEPEKNSHYALDYRIVTHRIGGMRVQYRGEELEDRASEFIGDLLTVARNLGFNCSTVDGRLGYHGRDKWKAGSTEDFYYADRKKGRTLLLDVRAFKNGNMHFRLHKDFILALNVEHGRLRGWLKTPREAVEELDDPKAAKYFNSHIQLTAGNASPMLAAPPTEVQSSEFEVESSKFSNSALRTPQSELFSLAV
jgi:hypothetical protein